MGCFLGCFGFSNSKRKRRKQPNRVRVQPRGGDQGFGCYEPLDSAYANLDVKEKTLELDSELKDEGKKSKEPFSCKIRKKVSFNLNVQTYEPIPKEEDSDDERSSKDAGKERESQSLSKGDSTSEKMGSYPSNYRYGNCVHSYDEEDEIAYEESDLDDDDDDYDLEEDEDEYDDDIACLRASQEKVFEKLKSLSVNRDSLTEIRDARNRTQYDHSVLTPVENLSQWKAVKAKAMPPVKRPRKENLMQEIAVDASLSNWLSSESKKSMIQAENISSFPWRSREEDMMPILDFTCLKA
ncbi:hypothetical protein M5689_006078 [Euphorbia peplus]|nr:hypothetical protein M5689_006078 [Euphorbia peplus]